METGASQFDFWAVAGPWIQNAVFFVLGVVVTVAIDRRRTERGERELWVWGETESLAKGDIGASKGALEYSVNGVQIEDPYELRISLWSHGKNDVPSEAFNGRPARIDFGVPIKSTVGFDWTSADETKVSVDEAAGVIEIHPSVVRKSMGAEWIFVTDGKPSIILSQEPLDTSFFDWHREYSSPRASKTAAKISGWLCVAAGIIIFIGALVFGPSLGPAFLDTWLYVASTATSALLVGGFTVLTFAVSRMGRRLRNAKRTLERRPMNAHTNTT